MTSCKYEVFDISPVKFDGQTLTLLDQTELPGEGGSDEEGVQEPDAGKGANEEAASQEQETDQEDSGNAPVATNEPAIEPREVSPSNVIDGT